MTLGFAAAAPAAAAQSRPVLEPPALVQAAEGIWPESEPVERGAVTVSCRVSLDATGAVVEVQVLETPGEAFSAAAVEAIRGSSFSPARRDGRAIPARFVFDFVLEPPPPPPPPPEPEPPPPEPEPPLPVITFEGVVLGEGDVPLEGAAISVETPLFAGPVLALADAEGGFYYLDLPPGAYRVRVSSPQFETLELDEEVVAGTVTRVVYRLVRAAGAFETVVRDRRPPREMTRQTLQTEEIVRMPGSGGDALRAVENLPGIARPVFGAGLLVIRGSAPQNTAFYVEGIQVPLLYHFGGLRSVVAPDFLDRIDYFPGNYSVRYGGVTAGVVDVVPRTPDRDAWSGYLDVNLIDAGAFAEGPLAENASIAAGLRRSYLDAVIAGVEDMLPFDSLQAPVYWDFQLLADWDPTEQDKVRFFAYGSDDRIRVFFDDFESGGPTLVGERTFGTSFYRFQAEWIRQIDDDLENRMILGVGYNLIEATAGPGTFDTTLGFVPFQIRDELLWELTEDLDVTVGVDTTVVWEDTRLRLPDFFSASGRQRTSFCSLPPFEATRTGWSWTPGLYLETEFRPVEGLRLLPGVRVDLYDGGNKPAVDPRFNARYEVVDGTVLKLGVGSYSQPPSAFFNDEVFGNPDLDPEQAIHYGLGFEQSLFDRLTLQLDLFYREVGNALAPTTRTVERDGRDVPLRFDNGGRTRAYGAELLVRYEPDDLFFGWIAMTVMQAEEYDAEEGWRETSFDQVLNLTALGSFKLGDGWSVGFRFRVAEGFPSTPVVGAVFNADCDEYERIEGAPNSLRLPWFHQLDLRVDKVFTWDAFVLTLYLDIQNVYFAQNVESVGYNFDFTERRDVMGLPILPAIGIKGEFR